MVEKDSYRDKKGVGGCSHALPENGTWRRRSNLELCRSYKESDIVNFIKIQRIKWQVTLSEWTKTAPLKKYSMPNQLVHEKKPGQILDGLMA
ncbi:hypothetical protein TNCV_866351 [Trichonephila clavipes]|nr:hypothetical protein TNCV_866351 [Trichonephila clavipes]